MREVVLPSGAKLQVNEAPFAEANGLYKSVLQEAKGVQFNSKTELSALFKDLWCNVFSSEGVEEKLWVCMGRCLYNGEQIKKQTFEPSNARQDYTQVCMEVAKDNISPFLKNPSAAFSTVMGMINASQESKS